MLVEAGFTGWAVEGHSEHGQRSKVNDCAWDKPWSVAVTETVSVVPPSGTVAVAVAMNLAPEDPARTLTVAGTINAGLLAETATASPPVGAGPERVSVQAAELPAVSVGALQANAETSTGASRLKVALWGVLLSVAVTVAAWVDLGMPAVAAKVAEMAPAATVTEAGTVSKALLSPRATMLPPVGAGWLRVTVQVVEAPG